MTITLWKQEPDVLIHQALGKACEEASELANILARCLIQGLDQCEPVSGKPNRKALSDEIADLDAAVQWLRELTGEEYDEERADRKLKGFRQWQRMLEADMTAPSPETNLLRTVRTFVMAIRAEAKGKDPRRFEHCDEILSGLDSALGIVRPDGPDTSPVDTPSPEDHKDASPHLGARLLRGYENAMAMLDMSNEPMVSDLIKEARAAYSRQAPEKRPFNPADPYFRMVMFFDKDSTAGSFLNEDGEGGFVGAVSRMAREIDRLRQSPAPQDHLVSAELADASKVNENACGSKGESSATCCPDDPNSDPKNGNIRSPQNGLVLRATDGTDLLKDPNFERSDDWVASPGWSVDGAIASLILPLDNDATDLAPETSLEGSEAEIEQYNADRESQGMSEDPTAYPDWATDAQDSPAANVLSFPRELTDDLRDVLSTMLWTSGQIARCLRAGGAEIKTRAEDEQAYVLHWLIGLALEHGSEWRVKAQGRIREIRDAQPATTKGQP